MSSFDWTPAMIADMTPRQQSEALMAASSKFSSTADEEPIPGTLDFDTQEEYLAWKGK